MIWRFKKAERIGLMVEDVGTVAEIDQATGCIL